MGIWTKGWIYVIKFSERFLALGKYLLASNFQKLFFAWLKKTSEQIVENYIKIDVEEAEK